MRYADLLDTYLTVGGLCHPADNFGAVLAVAEHVAAGFEGAFDFADAGLLGEIVAAVERLDEIPVAELGRLLGEVSPVAERPRTRHRR